jgi:hypothetical protein
LLLGLGWPPRQIFLFACVTALVGAICVVLLRVQARRAEPRPVLRQA